MKKCSLVTIMEIIYLSMVASRSKTSGENFTKNTAFSLRGGKPVLLLL